VSAFGVRSAYGTLARVLVHRPGPELDKVTPDTLREFHFARPVDRKQFVAEYDAMLALFRSHGVEALLLTDVLAGDDDSLGYIAHRPNMTYTRDLATVFSRGAVLMGPHLKGRKGDERMMARAFARLGVPVLGAIEPPGYLEGGGVTLVGEDTAVASLCDRANEEGTRALREIVPRHVMFPEFLEKRGFTCIPITLEERREGHLNVVVTERSRRAVGFASAVRVGAEMGRHGFELATFPSAELFMGRGGAHCMTCPLLVR
jgi:N-dimethylarginine dimethylaminohydrolase